MKVTPDAASGRRRQRSVKQTAGKSTEYTIDELARSGDSTVRNVRAYQDRGILPPPEKRGRVGVYGDAHLSRLRLINKLLSRGYTLGNIGEMLEALEKGHNLRQILGLEQAISSPWSDEVPAYYTLPQLVKMFKMNFNPRLLARVIKLGILEPDGIRYRAPRPRLLKAGAEFTKLGIPLATMLDIIGNLRNNVERVADDVVRAIVELLDTYEGKLPPDSEIPKLASLIWKLRPLADMAIDSEVSRALELATNKFLGERVAQLIEHMQEQGNVSLDEF